MAEDKSESSTATTSPDPHETNDGSNVFIVGLLPITREKDLLEICAKYGSVLTCEIVLDPHTEISRGFAFVKMGSKDDANNLITNLNGSRIDGALVKAKPSHRSGRRPPTPGTYSGRSSPAPQPPPRAPYPYPPPPYPPRDYYGYDPYAPYPPRPRPYDRDPYYRDYYSRYDDYYRGRESYPYDYYRRDYYGSDASDNTPPSRDQSSSSSRYSSRPQRGYDSGYW